MNTVKALFLVGVSTTALAVAAQAHAASFDCQKAVTPVEHAICDNPELSGLDDEMAENYQLALRKGNASTVKAGQRAWLKERNACGDDRSGMDECIKDQYGYRLNDLGRMVYLPQKLKACSNLMIEDKTTRLGVAPSEAGGEVVVSTSHHLGFYVQSVAGLPADEDANQYMYDTDDFAKGDTVTVCLVRIPKHCPPGDDRGKEYTITNGKNRKSFSATPDWHSCGGA